MVIYELIDDSNSWFEIDGKLGVVMVKDGVMFDVEMEVDVSVMVKVILIDGLMVSQIFMIDVIDGNELLDLVVEYGDVGKNFIKNGLFEIFDVVSGVWKQFLGDSLGGWISNGKMEIWDIYNGVFVIEGDQYLELDFECNVNLIFQMVEMFMGQVYDFFFDVWVWINNVFNMVEVYWNGELVLMIDLQFGSWEMFEFQVVGIGG